MKFPQWILLAGLLLLAASLILYAAKTDGMTVRTGKQAFSTTAALKPGVAYKITAKDLPSPAKRLPAILLAAGVRSARRTRCRRRLPVLKSACT